MSTSQDTASAINSLYLAFYGRPADPAGLKFWSAQLANNNGDATSIIATFAASEETQVRFASDSAAERIAEIYLQLFNRAPDAEGLAFYTKAIEQGRATLADVSVSILKGAVGGDKTLSELRQQAADAFTAQVEASGSAYDGYASIEAARVLVRAVTLETEAADVDSLVKAAVSFADVATRTPAVVGALASGGPLLEMFDTPRGLAEPVALLQSLADTAKAAAGNPDTLESLLRGGGMTKVLEVMPAKATLKDVVDALGKGGLPAAVDVVYPPSKPVTPAPSPLKLVFDSVSQGESDTSRNDNVTNVESATVKFTYTGKGLASGQQFEYSTDGGRHWSTTSLTVDTASRTVTIKDVLLGGGTVQQLDTVLPGIQFAIHPSNVKTDFRLRAVDSAKNVIAEQDQELVYDGSAPEGELSFYMINDGPIGDHTTSAQTAVVSIMLDRAYDDAIMQWRIKGTQEWQKVKMPAYNGVFPLPAIDTSKGDLTVEVRLVDAAGNVGHQIEQLIDVSIAVPTMSVMAVAEGLSVESTVAGDMKLVSGPNAAPLKSTSGSTQAGVGPTLVGEQDAAGTGTFRLVPGSGDPLDDKSGDVYSLGSSQGESLSGQLVWGFGGNDTIEGTDGDDLLVGGEGDDTILGGMGSDRILGGHGADSIDLGSDGAVDYVVYAPGDAAGAAFVDGGSTEGMDKITAFGNGDLIVRGLLLNGEASVQSTYLGSSAGAGWAVVRGSDEGGVFRAGTAASDDDYMVQWGDGEHINSTIVHDYGAVPLVATLAMQGNAIGFQQLPLTKYIESNLQLGGPVESHLVPWTTGGGITSVANPAGFALYDFASGANVTATNFITPYTVNGSIMHFSGLLPIGLYKMSWTTGTFMTGPAVLEGADVLMAGGLSGQFSYRGFEMSGYRIVDGAVESANGEAGNEAFISDGLADARIRTGGGYDVVSDQGSTLTIAYDAFDESAHDIILGFDKDDDAIVFEGAAASLLDKDEQGDLDWVAADAVNAQSEAVYLALDPNRPLFFGPGTHLGTTGQALGAALGTGVQAVAKGSQLLILASDAAGETGALMLYSALDDNNTIDANELATVAVFNDGVPDHADITLAGLTPVTPPVESEPFLTVTKHADGLRLETNVSGTVKMGAGAATTTEGDSTVKPGFTTLGVQPGVVNGTAAVELPGGGLLADATGQTYMLGTDAGQTMSGANLWSFGGNDTLNGTAGDDFLVGGTGTDRFLLYAGGNDTVVIGKGDTAIDAVAIGETVDISLMDTIVVASASGGDVLQVGQVFTAPPVAQSSFLSDPAANHYAVVAGSISGNTFTIGDVSLPQSMIAYMVQWADGEHVHSVILRSIDGPAPQFAIDPAAGTMTIDIVGVEGGIPGG